jgi:O-antigen/teichoic acid export membrane protein
MTAAQNVRISSEESILRPALLLMCGRGLAFVATFFIPVVLARIFDPAAFGTYKQLFLIQSTVSLIVQLGMGTSLYYFLPKSPADAGRYVANSVVFLGIAGLAGMALLMAGAPALGRWLSNNELSRYLGWMGLYLFLTMIASTLEVVLISRRRYLWASASYALSDLARAAALILPALLLRNLTWLLAAAAAVAFLRVAVALVYFRREFHGNFTLDRELLKRQLAYALPFAAAALIEILQGSIPQYAVSYLFNPATFAIFAVGCLQIPLVEFAAGPTSDVMMVRMQESRVAGRAEQVLGTWHDTTWKLALLFFPLATLSMISAPEIINGLFTRKYAASVPLFAAWTVMILFATFQVDGVMRVFAQNRFLLALNLMRLAIIGLMIRWFLQEFHLLGGVLVVLIATFCFKAASLIRMKTLMETRLSHLLPWQDLATLFGVSVAAAASTWLIKTHLAFPPLPLLAATTGIYAILFGVLVWRFDILREDERLAIKEAIGKAAAWLGKSQSKHRSAAVGLNEVGLHEVGVTEE